METSRRRGQEDAYESLGANRLRVQGMRRQRSRIAAVVWHVFAMLQ